MLGGRPWDPPCPHPPSRREVTAKGRSPQRSKHGSVSSSTLNALSRIECHHGDVIQGGAAVGIFCHERVELDRRLAVCGDKFPYLRRPTHVRDGLPRGIKDEDALFPGSFDAELFLGDAAEGIGRKGKGDPVALSLLGGKGLFD